MYILNKTDHTFNSVNFPIPTKQNDLALAEEQQPLIRSTTTSIRAGQRKLRVGNLNGMALKAIPDALVDALVKYGNNPDGIPALLYATKMGDLDSVKLLIEHGADPFTRYQGHTGALYYALHSKNSQVVEYFLSKGLDPNEGGDGNQGQVWIDSVSSIDTRSFELLIAYGMKVNSSHYAGQWGPAHVCIQNGRLDLLKLVLNSGGDLHRENQPNGIDPLVWSVSGNYPSGRGVEKIECLKWLMQVGILKIKDLDISKIPNPENASILANSYPEFLAYLIENDCLKINQKLPGRGDFPLHICLAKPELVQFLIENGAEVNAIGEYGLPPLHYAASAQGAIQPYLDSIKILLDSGADVNAKDSMGRTPLAIAVDPKIKKLLIDHGAI